MLPVTSRSVMLGCSLFCLLQILIQLKRFNTNAKGAIARGQQSRAAATAAAAAAGSSRSRISGSSSSFQAALDQDPLGDILGTPQSDKASVDTSVGGEFMMAKAAMYLLRCRGSSPFSL